MNALPELYALIDGLRVAERAVVDVIKSLETQPLDPQVERDLHDCEIAICNASDYAEKAFRKAGER